MHKHINFVNYWITKNDPFFLPNPGVLFAFWLLSFLAKQQKQNYPFLPLSYVLLLSKTNQKSKKKINSYMSYQRQYNWDAINLLFPV